MRPWKTLMAFIALSAFLTAIYPLASFVYASISGQIDFGVYYSMAGDTLCILLNITNNGSVSLDDFTATVVINASSGRVVATISIGDVGPGENASAVRCTHVVGEFSIEEVVFSFSVDGLYPLRVEVHGGD